MIPNSIKKIIDEILDKALSEDGSTRFIKRNN